MARETLTHWIGSRGELSEMGNSIETESYMAQSKELEYIAYRRENLKEHGRLFFKFLKLFYVLVFRIDI